MDMYAAPSPVVPPLLAADGTADEPEVSPPAWLPSYPFGQVELMPLPDQMRDRAARGLNGGDCFVFWPDAMPAPALLAGPRPFPRLEYLVVALDGTPTGDDDLILVLLPDGSPLVCTPATRPPARIALGPVTSSCWGFDDPEPAA